MKTTIELPDDLLAEAKAAAVRRRTTLKAMVEHALRREISFSTPPPRDAPFAIDSHGMPVFRRRNDTPLTSEMVYQMMDELGI